MELLQQLQDLKKQTFNKEEILKITSIEEIFFEISKLKESNTANYSNLYSVFDEIRNISLEQGGMNIFEEFLTLKYFYLEYVYNINQVLLDAAMSILGPVLLDYELENRFFKEDNFFQYYIERYNQFKQNNELTIMKLLNTLSLKDLHLEGEQLQEVIANLTETIGLK